MIAIIPQDAGKQIVYFRRWVMRGLGRSFINPATMKQLSFVSPRQSREGNACSWGEAQDDNSDGTICVWLCTLGTITHQGKPQWDAGRKKDPWRKQGWKESCDPQRDPGGSRGKRSILGKSECGSGSGLHFTPGLITQEELLWHQPLYGQRLRGVGSSHGTNPWAQAARSKRGLAGIWGTYLTVVCCWQNPIKAARICSFQWSFIKTEHRKKKKSLNSSMKSNNSQQENSSPSLLEQLLHLGNSDTSIPAL